MEGKVDQGKRILRDLKGLFKVLPGDQWEVRDLWCPVVLATLVNYILQLLLSCSELFSAIAGDVVHYIAGPVVHFLSAVADNVVYFALQFL
jgi:hypothetical protein